jgi:anaerobic ribonucleoside-triphosphate reductase activating protein
MSDRHLRPTGEPGLLNVHAFLAASRVNGPGARAVVWTQGCRRRCPGCCNPDTHDHRPRRLVAPAKLAERVATVEGIEGLTVSGGEPFEQPAAVAAHCRQVSRRGLSVMVFTGQTYEQLRASDDPAVGALLGQIDILVDGPFVRRLAQTHLAWRGSSNQRVRFLTDRYGPKSLAAPGATEVEARLDPKAAVTITGFPERTDLAALAAALQADHGIVLQDALGDREGHEHPRSRHPASSA